VEKILIKKMQKKKISNKKIGIRSDRKKLEDDIWKNNKYEPKQNKLQLKEWGLNFKDWKIIGGKIL
jgi:hypothetical protein